MKLAHPLWPSPALEAPVLAIGYSLAVLLDREHAPFDGTNSLATVTESSRRYKIYGSVRTLERGHGYVSVPDETGSPERNLRRRVD